mmetsp:Transcript_7093/g.10487  ORF Transcript_7093/g.10487 Transcript_7093/m.10487 type:complete len:264 (-) Transcript_7093:228-1019(-)
MKHGSDTVGVTMIGCKVGGHAIDLFFCCVFFEHGFVVYKHEHGKYEIEHRKEHAEDREDSGDLLNGVGSLLVSISVIEVIFDAELSEYDSTDEEEVGEKEECAHKETHVQIARHGGNVNRAVGGGGWGGGANDFSCDIYGIFAGADGSDTSAYIAQFGVIVCHGAAVVVVVVGGAVGVAVGRSRAFRHAEPDEREAGTDVAASQAGEANNGGAAVQPQRQRERRGVHSHKGHGRRRSGGQSARVEYLILLLLFLLIARSAARS